MAMTETTKEFGYQMMTFPVWGKDSGKSTGLVQVDLELMM